jgi:23S rRNA pseudouridine955/2504/2580 synthase
MIKSKVQQITISEDRAGQRIDNFIKALGRTIPMSHIYRIIRKGEVRANKKRVKPDYRLQAGDIIRVPPLKQAPAGEPPRPNPRVQQQISERILFEDEHLIVINKPAGMAVHGGSGISLGLIEVVRQLRPEAPCLELVHRLDRDTSGVLIIAKKRSALRDLHTLWREGKVRKYYLALVEGICRGQTVDAPLQKNILQSGERMVKVSPEGKPSLTVFTLQEARGDCSLVQAEPHTGRTHQIRVHAAHIGHPIVGDEKYRGRSHARMCLHALKIEIPAFGTHAPLTVSAPAEF